MDRDVELLVKLFERQVVVGKTIVFSYGMALAVAMVGQYYPQPLEKAYRQFMALKCPYTVCLKFKINHDKMLLHLLSTARNLIGWIEEPRCTRYFFSNGTDACVFKLTFG
jgi:hypothetical protein